jgi:hypothetical protein
MGKPTKEVSQKTLAKLANTDRNMVSLALRDDPRCPKALADKIKALAEEHDYKVTLHPGQHHNSKLTQDIADTVVEGVLTNKSLAKISDETGLCQGTAFKLVRGVKVPQDYPDNEEAWRTDVTGFLEVAIWKGTRRLADTAIEEIDSRTLPISLAVAIDKLNTLKGQPTSIHASLSLTASHRDLMKELGTKNQADVVEVETNAEVLPEGS